MEFFQTLAECSVAFAGLGAIHAVLKGGNTPRILHRSFTIVLTGSLTFIFSVLALLLSGFDVPPKMLWQVASGIGVVLCGMGGAFFYVGHRKLSKIGHVAQSPLFFFIAASLLLASVPLLFLNLGGWLWEPGSGAYAAALTSILAAGLFALLGSFWFPFSLAMRSAKTAAPADDPERSG